MRSKTISWLSGFLALLLALLLAACGGQTSGGNGGSGGSGGGGGGGGGGGSGSSPNFVILLSPGALTVPQGSSGSTTLTLIPQGGFTGTVNRFLVGAPSGVTLSPTSLTVSTSSPANQTLTVNVAGNVPPTNPPNNPPYNLKVKAVSGSIDKEANLILTVTVPPGTTWTSQTVGTANLNGVTYGGDRFVAVGAGGTILTSPNGTAWTSQTVGTANLLGVTYGDGRFVAVGASGAIRTSP